MAAFNPISPTAARQLVSGGGADETNSILADFVEAGLIRAYARVVETLSVGGGRAEVRDARIPRDLWRRIVAEGKISEVWVAGTARLDGDGLVGGKPAVIITGIRFDERAVRDAASKHAAEPGVAAATPAPETPKPGPSAATAAVSASPVVGNQSDAAPFRKRGLGADELCVSVNEAMEITGLGRTTIYKLRDEGKLTLTKVGGRTMVDAVSIRKLLGAPTGPAGTDPA